MKTHQIAPRRKELIKNLVLLEGHTRAGKFLLGKILDGFEKVEHFQYVGLMEQLPFLQRLGFMTRDAAVSLLKITVDENAYHLRLGRNLNFRHGDHSSLLNSFEMSRYLQRSFAADGNGLLKEMKEDGRHSVFIAHETLPNIDLFFEAFPKIKIISVQRHPVDIIYSWWKRQWCLREPYDPLYFQSCIKVGENSIPWFAYDWSAEYVRMSRPIDRIIKSVKKLEEMARVNYCLLSRKQQRRILFITHEQLIEDSWKTVDKIGKFLEINSTDFMGVILEREKCLRKIPIEQRQKKIEELRSKASKAMFKEMMTLSNVYEKYSYENTIHKLYSS